MALDVVKNAFGWNQYISNIPHKNYWMAPVRNLMIVTIK